MRKITLLAVAFVAVSFASCKKEYTCECSYTVNGVTYTSSATSGKIKKKDAKAWCDGTGSGYSGVSCSLK